MDTALTFILDVMATMKTARWPAFAVALLIFLIALTMVAITR